MLGAIINGVTDGAVFGLVALGLVLVYKATGVLNFGQGEIGTTAIYVAWVASATRGEVLGRVTVPGTDIGFPVIGIGLPVVLGAILSVAAAAGLGVAMERVVIRRMQDAPKVSLTVVTLGVATVLGGMQFVIFGSQPRVLPDLISGSAFNVGAGTFVGWGRIIAIVMTVTLGAGLYLFFKRTMFGLGVLAAAQNATSLRLTGISLARVSMFTWGAAGVIAALGGVILAPTIGAFHPFFMTLILIPSLAAALVGGMTSLPGAFVGGLTVGLTQSVVRYLWGSDVPGIEVAAPFVLILGVLLFRPQGLLGAEA